MSMAEDTETPKLPRHVADRSRATRTPQPPNSSRSPSMQALSVRSPGKYWETTRNGVYHCVVCDVALFSSDTKFDAGCGWPSFYAPLKGDSIENRVDYSHGMTRTETVCARCGAHLGHVFPDGPRTDWRSILHELRSAQPQGHPRLISCQAAQFKTQRPDD